VFESLTRLQLLSDDEDGNSELLRKVQFHILDELDFRVYCEAHATTRHIGLVEILNRRWRNWTNNPLLAEVFAAAIWALFVGIVQGQWAQPAFHTQLVALGIIVLISFFLACVITFVGWWKQRA
jgi:hypothetical protein